MSTQITTKEIAIKTSAQTGYQGNHAKADDPASTDKMIPTMRAQLAPWKTPEARREYDRPLDDVDPTPSLHVEPEDPSVGRDEKLSRIEDPSESGDEPARP